jgi:dethiobiotin synthetase
MVVGLRLGCLNHALLTAQAIERRGLQLAGWAGNAIDPAFARRDENVATLLARLPAPCLGIIPWMRSPDVGAAAAALPGALALGERSRS